MKIVVAGPRDLFNQGIVDAAIEQSGFHVTEIIHGDCSGVDRMAEVWARRHGIPVRRFPAAWKLYGKSAGPIRNRTMANHGDALVAVYGTTRGTADMVRAMTEAGEPVSIYKRDA